MPFLTPLMTLFVDARGLNPQPCGFKPNDLFTEPRLILIAGLLIVVSIKKGRRPVLRHTLPVPLDRGLCLAFLVGCPS
jgi:hypothetical protein